MDIDDALAWAQDHPGHIIVDIFATAYREAQAKIAELEAYKIKVSGWYQCLDQERATQKTRAERAEAKIAALSALIARQDAKLMAIIYSCPSCKEDHHKECPCSGCHRERETTLGSLPKKP